MIDLTTYALLRKQIATAASGISDVRAEGDELVFVLVDGHEVRVAIPATEIRDAVVRDDMLVLTLEDDKEVVVDATLTQSGQAADAKATGDVVSQLKDDMANKLPKSPIDWEAWTAEEQAAARERMGIPGDYELIEEITLEEDTALFMRDAEPDGTSYNFKNVVVLITSAKTAVGHKTIYTRIHSGDKTQASYCIFAENLNYYRRAVWRAKIENSELRFATIDTTYIYGAQNAVSGDASAYKESPNCNVVNDNITKIEISCSDNIPVGFLIQIFGVRA